MNKKKSLLDKLFEGLDIEVEDKEDDLEDIPTEYKDDEQSFLDMLTEGRKDKVDRLVKENKNKEGRQMEAERDSMEGKKFLEQEAKKKALDKMSPKMEIEIQKIEIKPKKKKEDEADLPVPVTGSF